MIAATAVSHVSVSAWQQVGISSDIAFARDDRERDELG
jgi:hypothetical protein